MHLEQTGNRPSFPAGAMLDAREMSETRKHAGREIARLHGPVNIVEEAAQPFISDTGQKAPELRQQLIAYGQDGTFVFGGCDPTRMAPGSRGASLVEISAFAKGRATARRDHSAASGQPFRNLPPRRLVPP